MNTPTMSIVLKAELFHYLFVPLFLSVTVNVFLRNDQQPDNSFTYLRQCYIQLE